MELNLVRKTFTHILLIHSTNARYSRIALRIEKLALHSSALYTI